MISIKKIKGVFIVSTKILVYKTTNIKNAFKFAKSIVS